jgi:nicotinate phosphoribosyltransferase
MEGLLLSSNCVGNMVADIALCTDFYELTMAAAYHHFDFETSGRKKKNAIFEMFVRKLPRNRSYMVAAGLEQAIYFLTKMRFNNRHISYIKSLKVFKDVGQNFFEYLSRFRFKGTVWAVPEGTILFPNEPIIRIEAPLIEAQIVETYVLSMINFQSLIATKASRIVSVCKGRPIIEFGSRRAHGPQAGVLAARASYIGGCMGTSNTLAGYKLRIPLFGTMAHSFVMSFDKEEEAFKEFNSLFPSGYLLVDTYDSLSAIKKIIDAGIHTSGIRLDSGDPYYESIEARRLLDSAGHYSTKIMISGDLNEYLIRDLVNRDAPIDYFGVGTELSTSRDDPAMNGVYKLVGIRTHTPSPSNVKKKYTDNQNDRILYKIKTSPGKKTYPGPKQIHRIIENNMIKEDVISLEDEKKISGYLHVPLLRKFLENGKILCKMPSVEEIQRYHSQQVNLLPAKFKDLDFVPEVFPVMYSEKLQAMMNQFNQG